MDFPRLKQKILKIDPEGKIYDLGLIEKAFNFAQAAHNGQKRADGQPYITHPLMVAFYILEMGLDTASIAGALLHDVAEDTKFTPKDIKKEFGETIAFLVDGVTKITHLGRGGHRDISAQSENLKKLTLSMAKDIRVILIKIADRLHNISTINSLPLADQKRIALETLEIYAPLAYRLGIGKFSGDLEDMAFPIVYPEEYKWVKESAEDKIRDGKIYIEKIIPVLKERLKENGVHSAEIHYRVKHYYSLYKKLLRYGMDFDKIFDIVAVRIIVNSLEECYAVLGMIHKYWPPLPGKIKDYIALPKPNGYQSLHTSVFCEKNKIVEIQIRAWEMHERAENGLASHWFYSEHKHQKYYLKRGVAYVPKAEAKWIIELRDWQKKIDNPEQFLESLKIEFLKDRIFAITPHGKVIDLPRGATPVDFAYVIHTEIGNSCSGAKIDGKISPLDQELISGQIVEILTQKNKKPSEAWLSFVKTASAQEKIKEALRKKYKIKINSKKIAEVKIIVSRDRPGILKEISGILSNNKINILSIGTKPIGRLPGITIRCDLSDREKIEKLIIKIKRIKEVGEINYKIIESPME